MRNTILRQFVYFVDKIVHCFYFPLLAPEIDPYIDCFTSTKKRSLVVMNLKLRVTNLRPDAIIPACAHLGDSGLDLHACALVGSLSADPERSSS